MLRSRDKWLFVFWLNQRLRGYTYNYNEAAITSRILTWSTICTSICPRTSGWSPWTCWWVLLHTLLVEADQFRTYSLNLKSYLILIYYYYYYYKLSWLWLDHKVLVWLWSTSPTCPTSPSWGSGMSTSTNTSSSTYSYPYTLLLLRCRHCFWLLKNLLTY